MKKYLYLFLFLIIFFKVDVYADDDLSLINIKTALYNDSQFDSSKDVVLVKQRNLSDFEGKKVYSYVVFNADIYANNQVIHNKEGRTFTFYVDSTSNEILKTSVSTLPAVTDRSSYFYFKTVNYNAQEKKYDVVIDNYYKHTPFDFVEAKVVLEDVYLKKNFYLGRSLSIIGLLMDGMRIILKIVKEIIIMGVSVLILVLSLIGSAKYLKRLLPFRKRF